MWCSEGLFVPSSTHICLDELWALFPYFGNEPKHIDLFLRVHHVDHGVYDNEGSCSANTSAAETKQTEWRTTILQWQSHVLYVLQDGKTEASLHWTCCAESVSSDSSVYLQTHKENIQFYIMRFSSYGKLFLIHFFPLPSKEEQVQLTTGK